MLVFLGLSAEGVNHRADHVDTERHDHWRAGQCHGVGENLLLTNPPASTAVLYRPIGCDPAALMNGLVPTRAQLSINAKAQTRSVNHFLSQIFSDKGVHVMLQLGDLLLRFVVLGHLLLPYQSIRHVRPAFRP